MALDQLTHCLFSNLIKYLIGWSSQLLKGAIHNKTIPDRASRFFPYLSIYAQHDVFCDATKFASQCAIQSLFSCRHSLLLKWCVRKEFKWHQLWKCTYTSQLFYLCIQESYSIQVHTCHICAHHSWLCKDRFQWQLCRCHLLCL